MMKDRNLGMNYGMAAMVLGLIAFVLVGYYLFGSIILLFTGLALMVFAIRRKDTVEMMLSLFLILIASIAVLIQYT